MKDEADAPAGKPRRAEDIALPGGDFRLLVQKLGYQALLGLGVLENPLTGSKAMNLEQARGVIDDLLMLREKTRGNLEEEEGRHLEGVIRDLETHYGKVDQG